MGDDEAWVSASTVDLLLSPAEACELLGQLLTVPAVEARLGAELVDQVREQLRADSRPRLDSR